MLTLWAPGMDVQGDATMRTLRRATRTQTLPTRSESAVLGL
jgi:hypothetical protein